MPGLNAVLVMVISDLNRRMGEASVKLTSSPANTSRVLHIVRGCLVATESSFEAERLGNMLTAEGRLDPALLEPVANEARRRGTLLGHQLVADGLMTPTDLASALERQGRLRLQNALAARGTVRIFARAVVEPMVRIPLGAAVASAFRERISLGPIQELIAERPKQPVALDLQSELFTHLELGPSELRVCRGLAAGWKLEETIASSASPDAVVRLIGVLVALGLWA